MNNIDYAPVDFRHVDLNLLVVFDALLREGGVSAAARALCLGQPAVSHALGRLRQLFNDPLFLREQGTMRPTPRALALGEPVRQLLGAAKVLVSPELPFDPARAEGEFNLAMPDPFEAIWLPRLMLAVSREAPRLRLRVHSLPGARLLGALDEGSIDLAIAGFMPRLASRHEAAYLLTSSFDCLYCPNQLRLPPRPDLAELARHDQVSTTYVGGEMGNAVEEAFRRHGLSRRVVVSASGLLAVPHIVAQSPVVAILPRLITRLFVGHSLFRIEPLPRDILHTPVHLVWNRRRAAAGVHRFMTGLIRAMAPEVEAFLSSDTPTAMIQGMGEG